MASSHIQAAVNYITDLMFEVLRQGDAGIPDLLRLSRALSILERYNTPPLDKEEVVAEEHQTKSSMSTREFMKRLQPGDKIWGELKSGAEVEVRYVGPKGIKFTIETENGTLKFPSFSSVTQHVVAMGGPTSLLRPGYWNFYSKEQREKKAGQPSE